MSPIELYVHPVEVRHGVFTRPPVFDHPAAERFQGRKVKIAGLRADCRLSAFLLAAPFGAGHGRHWLNSLPQIGHVVFDAGRRNVAVVSESAPLEDRPYAGR